VPPHPRRGRWLLTTSSDVARAELEDDLAELDVEITDAEPTPLADEQVFAVEGPADLPDLLATRDTCVHAVYPDTDPEAYGPA
jgi:hypothetical protein